MYAISAPSASVRLDVRSSSTRPSRSVTRKIAMGSACTPRVASVPKAEAISISVTSFVPRASDRFGCSALVMPMRLA